MNQCNPFAWTVDNLNQPGFSAALLSISDMVSLPAHLYDMGKESVALPEPDVNADGRLRAKNAEGVAESWKREEVLIARITRDAVRCTVGSRSTESKSLRESFRVHGLPDHQHIRFRMRLKASGREVFVWEGIEYHFELVAR